MGQKVTLNESQLREKVYNMVCESLESIFEGKTFKDQKSWGKKGFQKQNKFNRNGKGSQGWKNGQMKGDDQGELDEGVDEINWKTYQNAARKANQQGRARQRDAFVQAAADSFNDEHGYEGDEEHYGSDYYAGSTHKKYEMNPSLYYPSTKLTTQYSWQGDSAPKVYSYNPHSTEEFPLGSFRKNGDYDIEYGNSDPKFQFGGDEPGRGFMARKAANGGMVVGPRKIDVGNKDLYDYEKGNYDYNNEKGWHLKDKE